MKHLKAKEYYLLASFLVVLLTIFLFRAISSFNFAANKQDENKNAFLVHVESIPVLKENLPNNLLNKLNISLDVANTATNSSKMYVNYEDFSKSITAKSAYVEDVDTGTILFERNSERILLPASTTKLMTILVALEEYDLDQVITVPKLPQIEGLKHEFIVNGNFLVKDLIKAALIQSSNDAAYILALSSQNGLENFVDRMNQKAQELHLKSTHYENPAGFDNDTQRSSAHDLVILSKEFMKNKFLASVVSTKESTISDVSGKHNYHLVSTHKLLGVDPTVVGIKTGTTEGAAQVLITQFNRDNHKIIIVVMGSDDRYLETIKLVDWVFDSYFWLDPQDLI